MTDSEEYWTARRTFLAAVGSGMVALAGCSSNGENPTDTTTTTEEDSPASGTEGESPASTKTTTSQQYDDQNELPAERQLEQKLLNNNYAFIEIPSQDIQMSNLQTIPSGEEPEDPYEAMNYNFRNFYARNGDPEDSIIFGYDMEPSGDSRNMLFKDFAQSESADSVTDSPEFGYSGTYKESAIQTFFDQNISGVSDVSDNFPDDLLELATE